MYETEIQLAQQKYNSTNENRHIKGLGQYDGASVGDLPSWTAPEEVVTSTTTLQHPSPISLKPANIAYTMASWNSDLEARLNFAKQRLHSQKRAVAHMEYRLAEQKDYQAQQAHSLLIHTFQSPRVQLNHSMRSPTSRMHSQPSFAQPPPKQLPLQTSFKSQPTPMTHESFTSLQDPPYKFGRRHHRTATPEQRTIREIMGGKPVFTWGINPQNDRCLISDFFEHIRRFAAMYAVPIRSLNAEQVHNLSTHPVLAYAHGKPSQMAKMITENEMLVALVALVLSKHMWTYALDEHSLFASGHTQAALTEDLAYRWTRLGESDHKAKHALLLEQQQVYTSVKEDASHKAWRTACAERLTNKLLCDLSGLLATNLSGAALAERNHILSELHVKAYRIGFRLRMAAVKWVFCWPRIGAVFEPSRMVNESRMLYGDMLCTMNAVMTNPDQHIVILGLSPTVMATDFLGGVERKSVVHHAMVHITRRQYF